jgi:hypothetical protein
VRALNLLCGTHLGERTNVPLKVNDLFPGIPSEFTNWRDETRAWQSSCGLLEQSYHMMEISLREAGGVVDEEREPAE